MDPINPVSGEEEAKRSPITMITTIGVVSVFVVAAIAGTYLYTKFYQSSQEPTLRPPKPIVLEQFKFTPENAGNFLFSLQFRNSSSNESGLYKYNFASKNLAPVLSFSGNEVLVSGAEDSKSGRLAVVVHKTGKDELRIYTKGGTVAKENILPVEFQGKDVRDPVWSADGAFLAYSVRVRGGSVGPAVPIPADWDTIIASVSGKNVVRQLFRLTGKNGAFLTGDNFVLMRNDGLYLVQPEFKTEQKMIAEEVRKGLVQYDVSSRASMIVWTNLSEAAFKVAKISPENKNPLGEIRTMKIRAHSPSFSPDASYIGAIIVTEGAVVVRTTDFRASYLAIDDLSKFKLSAELLSQWTPN